MQNISVIDSGLCFSTKYKIGIIILFKGKHSMLFSKSDLQIIVKQLSNLDQLTL